MEFSELDLDDRLLSAVAEAGWRKPTSVQQKVIPEALLGRDIMAESPTGTGKTGAFVLPALQLLIDSPVRKRPGAPAVLVISPTREIALQTVAEFSRLGKDLGFSASAVIGGEGYDDQEEALSAGAEIIVATPGRLLEYQHIGLFDGRNVRVMVLDEADRMLDMGFGPDVLQIVSSVPDRAQVMLFSATLEGRGVEKFAEECLKDPVTVRTESPRSEHKKIPQYYCYCDSLELKRATLLNLLGRENYARVLVFVRTRERLEDLSKFLQGKGVEHAVLRGEMEQERRAESVSRFSGGAVKVMLATDVAARGIDLPDVTHVINYDLPWGADVYVHRIGRTGRAGKSGTAVSLVEAHDFEMVGKIERYTGETVRRRVIEGLEPKTRAPVFSGRVKGKKRKDAKEDERQKEKKQQLKAQKKKKDKNIKDKGKPDFAAKAAARRAKAARDARPDGKEAGAPAE